MKIIGHEDTKKQIKISITSAVKRNMSPPHMLFAGSAGCGKTSMARYVANKTNAPFLSVVPNDMKTYVNVKNILDKLDHRNYDERGNRIGIISPTILFFDEIHNMPPKGQELFGLAMERFRIESGRTNKFTWTPFFTMIGATTIPSKLLNAFRTRFKLNFLFQPYEIGEMVEIVKYHANLRKVVIVDTAAFEVAKRSRGIPRIAVGFVERVRDYMCAIGSDWATVNLVKTVFEDLKIDSEGLTAVELKMLRTLFEANKPVSIDNLAMIIEQDVKTIQGYVEPFLVKKEFVLVSGKGRIITEKGISHIENHGHADKPKKQEIDFDYVRK